MNKWQKITAYIDTHPEFQSAGLDTLQVDSTAMNQYKHYLKKAGFIEKLENGNYRRLQYIGDLSIYQVKEIGYDND